MAWVFAGWLFSGCATQMPASEGLVFTEKESPAKNASFGEQISGEMAAGYSYIIPFEQLADAAANDFEDDSFDALDKTFLSTLLVPSFFIAYRDRVALGSTVSLPGFWQVDGTVRFFGQYYFTLNRKILLQNTEVILQRRLLYKNNGGISLGAFYRYDPLILKEENGDNTSSTFHISWFGLRTVLQSPSPQKTGFQVHLRGIVNTGYVPEFKSPLISVGISVAFRFDRQERSQATKPFH